MYNVIRYTTSWHLNSPANYTYADACAFIKSADKAGVSLRIIHTTFFECLQDFEPPTPEADLAYYNRFN